MKQCLNDVFGIFGMGWNYKYDPAHPLIQSGSKDGWTEVLLKTGTFWFMMVDESNEIQKIIITASDGSENKQMQHGLKGAITNMIGNAVSQIGFQSSVYMGKRTHTTQVKAADTKKLLTLLQLKHLLPKLLPRQSRHWQPNRRLWQANSLS